MQRTRCAALMRGRGGRSGYVSQLPPKPKGWDAALKELKKQFETETSHVGHGFGNAPVAPGTPARAHGDTSIREGHWYIGVYTDDEKLVVPTSVRGSASDDAPPIPVVKRAIPKATATSLNEGGSAARSNALPPRKQDKVT